MTTKGAAQYHGGDIGGVVDVRFGGEVRRVDGEHLERHLLGQRVQVDAWSRNYPCQFRTLHGYGTGGTEAIETAVDVGRVLRVHLDVVFQRLDRQFPAQAPSSEPPVPSKMPCHNSILDSTLKALVRLGCEHIFSASGAHANCLWGRG